MKTLAALLLVLLPALLDAQELLEYRGTATPPTVEARDTANSFKTGARIVNDRADTWTGVPAELAGLPRLLCARNDRKLGPPGAMYVLSLPAAGTVYLPLDKRYLGAKLSWMGPEWTTSGLTAMGSVSNSSPWSIWQRAVQAGEISFGTDDAGTDGMCFVFDLADAPDPPPEPPPPDPDPDPEPQVVHVNPFIHFEASGLDVNGGEETYSAATLAIASDTVDMNDGGDALKAASYPVDVGANVIQLTTFYAGIPDGSYLLWIQLVDQAGNVSTWAKSTPFVLHNVALSVAE